MDELNLKTLEQIPIPEGLEERLSKKIDEWGAKPTTPSIPPRGEASNTPPRGRWRGVAAAAAACLALVLGFGIHYLQREELPSSREGQGVGFAEQDTYQDPVKAQQEAERALNMLAMNLNKGMGHLERAKALSEKTEQSFYEKLKVMK